VVTKVGPKIFAFLRAVGPGGEARGVGLKCAATREAADEWLLRYPGDAAVMPYIGRSGWNTLTIGAAIPDDEILEAIDASYAMVVSKLPKKDRPI
jgi:predicted DNA-binding protein (MmcQ/YjbR family)